MTRLIDAEKLKKHYAWWEDDERRHLFDQIVDAQPTIDIEPHWIPCSERMPSEGKYVLVTCDDDDILIMEYDGTVWRTVEESIKYETSDIDAWMPLPKPYEVENEKID